MHLPSLDRLYSKMEIERMSEHKESFVISVWCVGLQLTRIFAHDWPVFSVEQRCLDKDAVSIRGEVSASNNLPDEVNLWLIVRSNSLSFLADLEFG